MVKGYDAAGNAGSASVNVSVWTATVQDASPPSVSIQSPQNGATVSGTTQVSVNATDNVAVTQVTVYIDGIAAYTATASPYTYSWNTKKSSPGSHKITAKAWDAAGNATVSTEVKVTVVRSNGR